MLVISYFFMLFSFYFCKLDKISLSKPYFNTPLNIDVLDDIKTWSIDDVEDLKNGNTVKKTKMKQVNKCIYFLDYLN